MSLASIACSGACLAASPPAQVWFSPIEPFTRELTIDTTDFTQFLHDGDAWRNAAARIHVIKMSTQFLSRAPDPVLRDLLLLLRQHNIALGVEALMLTGHDGCGGEGYSAPGQLGAVAGRIKRLGGELAYVAMDGPLWGGHISSAPKACHDSIARIAADVAEKAHAIWSLFPNAIIGDIEPAGKTEPKDYLQQISEWTNAYRNASGAALGFLHADVQWSGPWQTQLSLLAKQLHRDGIRFGIIYNGNPDDPSGEIWVKHAEERFVAVEASAARVPDDAVLQTWHPYPRVNLPESALGTMTSLVDRYEALSTDLSLAVEDTRISGLLADAEHVPLQDAEIDVFAGGEPKIDPTKAIGDRRAVPPLATAAIFGLRVNTECGCSSTSTIEIGDAELGDEQSGSVVVRHLASRGERWLEGPGRGWALVSADPQHPLLVNSEPFSVKAGSRFSFRVPIHVTSGPATKSSGYVAVIFLGPNGTEVARQKVELVNNIEKVASVKTGREGRFSVRLEKVTADALPAYTAVFRGDAKHRMS
jgi:hypothetical protein